MTHEERMAEMDKQIEEMNGLRFCCKSVRRQLEKRRKRSVFSDNPDSYLRMCEDQTKGWANYE